MKPFIMTLFIKLIIKCIFILFAVYVLFLILFYNLFVGQFENSDNLVELNEINLPRCQKYYLNVSLEEMKEWDWQQLPIVSPNCKNRILIVSQHRSGSSFFGDLLQQSWPSYYLYEPLYILGETVTVDQVKNRDIFNVALDTMVDVFNCKSLNETRYDRKIYWNIHWTKALEKFKKQRDKLSNAEQVCQKCSNLIVKSVRVDIDFLVQLSNRINYDENPLKTVVLMRDPRAIMNSRFNPSLGFCFGKCRNPAIVCQQIRSKLNSLIQLNENSSKISDHLTIVRYEDLSMNTISMTQKLYQRLGLSFTNEIKEWIDWQISYKRNNLNTPLRNTTENVISWVKTFKEWKMDLNSVQRHCSDVMEMLGYKSITVEELNNNQTIHHDRLISDNYSLKNLLTKNFVQ